MKIQNPTRVYLPGVERSLDIKYIIYDKKQEIVTMDPYGTFGGERGVPSPPPSPKGDISPIEQAIPTMDPSWKRFEPMQKIHTAPTSPAAPATRGFQPPQENYMQQAIDIYESMGAPVADPSRGGPQVTYGQEEVDDSSWAGRLYAERAASTARNSRSGGGAGAAPGAPRAPYQAIKAPDMPTFQGEEYAPPERDQAIYDEERQRSMGPGLRALREGTREAIASSQSLDNPNARSMFIKQALRGYGQGLEQVSAQAGKEATSISDRRHAEDLQTYRTKYDYRRDDQLRNYQAEVSRIAADFAAQSQAAQTNWAAGMDTATTGGATAGGGRIGGDVPFMGYMA